MQANSTSQDRLAHPKSTTPFVRSLVSPAARWAACAAAAVLVLWVASAHGAPCPDAVRIDVDGSAVDFDLGWTGIVHDNNWFGMTLTMDVSGCAGSMQGSCGQCTASGPIANGGGAAFENRRCADKTWIACDDNTDCTNAGAAGPCGVFLGPPLPISAGGVTACFTSEIPGPVSGTVNPDTGALSMSVPLVHRIHVGGLLSEPCARCVGGFCSAGPRMGQACTTNAVHPVFGNLSFDCPPDPMTQIGTLIPENLPLSTATQTKTLGATSPNCTAFGATGSKCMCDTCNHAAATPCSTHTDCTAVGATICGGLRCLLSSNNVGSPCATAGVGTDPVCGLGPAGSCSGPPVGFDPNSCVSGPHPGSGCFSDQDCGGFCGRPGESTRPNACSNGECVDASVPGAPPFGQGPDEGVCQVAPHDSYCSVETFRACSNNASCRPPAEGGSCFGCLPGFQTCAAHRRECFFDIDEIGSSSRTMTATGQASPPIANVSSVSLGSLFCMKPVGASAANIVIGLPGPGRLKLKNTTLTFADEIADGGVPSGGGTVTTDTEGDGATAADPIETTVTSPNPGSIEITEGSITGTPPGSFTFVGQQVSINAPAATVGNPLILVFTIDSSVGAPLNVAIFRNGLLVPSCSGAGATPNPCVANRQLVAGDVQITVRTSTASNWNFGVSTVNLCGSIPAGCHQPAVPQKALVLLKDDGDNAKDKLLWKWIKGETTFKFEYGNPNGSTSYELCLEDGTGPIGSALIPAGSLCEGEPCWQDKPTSLKFKDKNGTYGGITKILLKEGLENGKAKVIIKGKGVNVPMPNLPALVSPLAVHLVNSDGECWSATYSFPPALKNDGAQFKDKAD